MRLGIFRQLDFFAYCFDKDFQKRHLCERIESNKPDFRFETELACFADARKDGVLITFIEMVKAQ